MEKTSLNFFEYLCRKIGKRKATMNIILKNTEQRGRKKKLSTEHRQLVYDTWHEFSIVTVDRRNNRDVVKINRSEFLKYEQLKTPSENIIEYYTSKRNQQKVKSTRYIATKTVREIQHTLETKHDLHFSLGIICSLKPFYIVPPSEREKESCLCKFCLNLHLKFDALQKHLKDKTRRVSSMSSYFANGISCAQDQNGFYQLKCISSDCDKCKLVPVFKQGLQHPR